jgi:7-cyano-7-deazaguanine synthase
MAEGEMEAAERIARAAGVAEHRVVSIPQLRELSDMQSKRWLAGLPRTYIPMKNATYYSLAAAFAEETGSSFIVGGHNSDDLRRFEDTSDEFFVNLQRALRAGSARLRERRTRIWRPLRRMPKVKVVSLAYRLGVPLEMTWSCHMEGSEHCWKCEGCVARKRSFIEAGVKDPLLQDKTENV